MSDLFPGRWRERKESHRGRVFYIGPKDFQNCALLPADFLGKGENTADDEQEWMLMNVRGKDVRELDHLGGLGRGDTGAVDGSGGMRKENLENSVPRHLLRWRRKDVREPSGPEKRSCSHGRTSFNALLSPISSRVDLVSYVRRKMLCYTYMVLLGLGL